MTMRAGLRLIPFALVLSAAAALEVEPGEPSQSAPVSGAVIGLADSAGLRATVFGTPPQAMAPLPAKVPLSEINA